MNRKCMILLLFVCLTLTVSFMSHTYSRYAAGTDGTIQSNFASWQILINEEDVFANASSVVEFTPIIIEDENTAVNTIAPTSQGYFDIDIDPSNVSLSFRYSLNVSSADQAFTDLYMTKYEILDETKISNPDNVTVIADNTITNVLLNNGSENFRHDKFTIRVYFEWYDGNDESSNDESDTQMMSDDVKLDLIANITFEQIA